MNTVSRAFAGTVAAVALTASVVAPAHARDRDGIDAGDVIVGAVVLGGIAILASAGSRDRDGYTYRDRRYGDDRYYGRGNPRSAVERCVNAAEQQARRYGYRYADVTEIRDVDDTRYGWRVKGNLRVDGQRGWRGGDRRDGYGCYAGRGHDNGSFTCHIERGRVADIDYRGIRGLG